MELFGSFGFGRILKTLLPGFVALLGMLGYAELTIIAINGTPIIIPFALARAGAFSAAAVPVAIILGVLSNTVCFVYAHRALQRHHAAHVPRYYELAEVFRELLAQRIITTSNSSRDAALFIVAEADISGLLLPLLQVDKLAFVKERFWSYGEFQLNMLAAVTFAIPAALWWWVALPSSSQHSPLLLFMLLIAYGFFARLSIKAAWLNFKAHKMKTLSFQLGSILLDAPGSKGSSSI
jgi:hypothetical protein